MSERKLIEYFVEDNARFALNDLAQFLVKEYTNVNNLRFLNYCRLHAFKLPEELIKRIITFYRDEEGDGYIIIRKLALIDDIYIGDTPNNWKQGDVNPKSYYLDFILVLIIAIISEPVAYLEQRPDGGGIVHDVIPLLDDDVKQVGSGSSEELLLHTEDITLENSCDFTALLSVRNHEEALSSLSIFNEFKISDESKTILFGDNFIFPPDPNYEYEHQN
ncbi:MAG TPA: hypothetical protein PKY97_00575, partial [Saprospiraceae bacterium]|nr:hypothetical protein [Saprospiraceae bacterium]